ncbi:MAG: CsbD family protein [Syntrophales bacterium]|nr:CsbD family protein [Syntrophales bacterium]
MNEDILKGSWLEIKGRVKEKWGKLTDNGFGENEGKGMIHLGLLRKRYGYIRDKAKLEYEDTVELAGIISNISKTMKKTNFVAIAFVARYGRPLLAKKQESKITGKDEKHGNDTDRYFNSRLSRRNTHLASQ